MFLKHPYKRFCFFIFFIFTHRDFSLFFSCSCLSFHLSLSYPCRLPLLLPLMSTCLSFSHPCLSFSLSVAVSLSSTPVSLPIFLSPTMPLFFCGSLSLLSPSLSFSRPYLSISRELRSLCLSLSLSPIHVSLSLSLSLCLYLSLSLSHSCLSSYLSLSYPVSLSVFSLFLSPIPVSLSLFFLTLVSFSCSLSLSLSFYNSNPYFSISHSCLSFHLFSLPSLSSSSLSPTHVSLSIFVTPLSILLPLCGSLFHPYLSSYLSLSHRCLIFLYPSLSFSLTPVSLFLSPSKEREHKIIL